MPTPAPCPSTPRRLPAGILLGILILAAPVGANAAREADRSEQRSSWQV